MSSIFGKTHKTILSTLFALSAACIGMAAPAHAYLDVLDTGEITKSGTYKLTGDLQLLTDVGGANVGGIFDMGFQDEYGVRTVFGVGRTNFYAGGFFKWMPIPDIAGQPAIGFNTGLIYGSMDGNRDLTVRFEPLASKKFAMESGYITPYVALPIGLRSRDSRDLGNSSDVTLQLVTGAQLQVEKWKRLQFIGEVGLDLGKAPSYISAAAIFYYDQENGFHLE